MNKVHRNSLKPGHKLQWYEIKEILGQGGFGITYLAHDVNLMRNVAIKEYLPVEIAMREKDFSVHPLSDDHGNKYKWGLDRFISEARTLAKFNHPNIVRVDSVFEDNNTGYMVMQYELGRSLREILEGKKTLDAQELQKIVLPLLGGLEQIHRRGFIHRDIKPDNIYIRKNGSPVLLDFGSARQALSEETKTLTSLVTPGYAPFEQYYSRSDEQGPFSDIYGMGATLYRAVTGIAPIDAIERGKSILTTSKDAIVSASEIAKGKYPDHILMAIDHAIQFKAEERPQTIEEWLKDFEVPVATTIKSKAQKQISEKRDAELSLSKNLEEAYETARTYNVNQSTLKPEVEEVVKQDPPPPQSQKAASQNTPRNSVNTHLTISLVLLVLIGVGIYLFSREYSKEKPVQQSVEMAESIKQKQLIAEQNATSAKLRDATKIKDRQIEKLLESAENDLQENRLTSPSGNNAYDKYNKVLELNFGNKKAVAGIEKILDSYQSSFNESLASQQFDQAAEYIERIRAIHPDSTRLLGARRLLNDATEREKTNNLQAETEQAKRAANATRAREAEKIKRKEELTAQNRLSMNNKVYDNLMEAQELFEAKKYDQGLEVLRALELEKNLTPYEKAQLYNSFGLTYFTLEKPNDAVRSYEKVLEQADLPEAMITRALYSLAQIYYSMDEFTKSLEPLKKSYKMTMDSGDEPRETLLQLMSANYHKLGDYKNMVNVLKKMVSLYPKTDYWLSLAGAYSALAQHENQITVMEMLYEQGELKTGTQQVNFASLYLLRDKPLKAIEVLEKGMSEGTIERTTLNQFLLSKAQKSAQGLEQGSPGK